MNHRLPLLPEPLNSSLSRPLREGRAWQRAAIAALDSGGIEHRSIALFTATHLKTVRRWVGRVKEGKPLTDIQRGGRPRFFSEAARLMTIAVYCQQSPPLPGVHRWSLSDAQRYFKEHCEMTGYPISRATIHRILLEHALRPHRRKYYLQITDPEFFPKMEHIIQCYSNPPENLYCFDECTCIQALKRLTPTLPATAGQPALEDFDYRRNGTTDLLAFLNPATGNVTASARTIMIGIPCLRFSPAMCECIRLMRVSTIAWIISAHTTTRISVRPWPSSAVCRIRPSKPVPNAANGSNPRTNALWFTLCPSTHPG